MTITSNLSLQTLEPEFIANSITPPDQMLPDVLRLSDGGYVVAYNNWSSVDGTIMLDFYDASSTAKGMQVPHDTPTTSAYGRPSLTQLETGTVLVAWANHDPAELGIRVAGFTPTGQKINGEMLVFGQCTDVHVDAFDSGDAFVLTYTHNNHVYARAFHDGVGTLAQADLAAGSTVYNSTSAALANGRFVVAWSSDPNGPADAKLHARIFNNNGSPVTGELTLDSVGGNKVPSIAALPNGNWAIAYSDTGWGDESGSTGISLKILTPDGQNAMFGSSTIHVNTPNPKIDTQPSVTVLDNGYILVTWQKEVVANSYDVLGRVFTQSGQPVMIDGSTGEFTISSPADNDFTPDVAALQAGRFVTAWIDDSYAYDVIATVKELVRVTTGDDADDTFTGDALRDIISSGGGNDTIDGGAGDDTIDAGAGNDTVLVSHGKDLIDGGAGEDTTVFAHNAGDYGYFSYNDKIEVYVYPSNDITTLTNVEHLQFADGTVHVNDGNAVFDTLYYMVTNPDVLHSGLNALDHFNTWGWREGRNPNEVFDTSEYLAANPDVAAAGVNPLDHYHQFGWHEGRDPSASFDTTLYLIHNPDVAAAGIDPLEHFLQYGAAQGRETYEAIGPNIAGGFDAQYYRMHNPDVAAAGVDPLGHFNQFGWHEGRNPNGFFDTAGYLSHYSDVAAAGVNPLEHYNQFGWHEGRDPSARFDTQGYLAANPDVAAAGVNPLEHYLQFGIYEGRTIVNDGLWH